MASTANGQTEVVGATRALQRKVQQILHSNLFSTSHELTDLDTNSTPQQDSKENLLQSLEFLSSFYTDNTIQNRRNLRGQIEKKLVEKYEHFLLQYAPIYEHAIQFQQTSQTLAQEIEQMDQQIQSQLQKTKPFLLSVQTKSQELNELNTRKSKLEIILKQFQLSEEEKFFLLEAPVEPLQFFPVLKRAHDIHALCKQMLLHPQQVVTQPQMDDTTKQAFEYLFQQTLHNGTTTLGIEIMEEMSNFMNIAYERLSRWIQEKCKLLAQNQVFYDDFIVEQELQKALKVLEERPVLFECCIKEIVSARKLFVVSKFLDALTRGSSRSNSKPIDLHAHDSLRYIGDILAWIHQSVASEKELIYTLLSMEERNPQKESTQQYLNICIDMLNQIFESLSGQLKIRVEEILKQSEDDFVIFFRLAHLLELYASTISKLSDNSSSLCTTLLEVRDASLQKFFKVLEHDTQQYKNTSILQNKSSNDYSPPMVMVENLEKLVDIMNTYSKSVVPEERKEEDFKKVLELAIDPMIQFCKQIVENDTQSSQQTKRFSSPSESYVFLLNCFYAMQTTLDKYSFTTHKVEQIVNHMDHYIEKLIQLQSQQMITNSGLQSIIDLIKSGKKPLSKVNGLQSTELSESIRQFYHLLFTMGAPILQPQMLCDKIAATKLRNYARNRLVGELSNAYTFVYNMIYDSENGYENPKEIAFHSPKQVNALFS